MQKHATTTGYYIAAEAKNWLDKWNQDGCKEIAENKIYCSDTGKKVSWYPYSGDGDPWCAAFVSTVLSAVQKKIGYSSSQKMSASTVDFEKSKLQKDYQYAVGAVFFRKSKGGQTYGHVGIVVDWDTEYVYTIEGNTGNAIALVKHKWYDVQNGTSKFGKFLFVHTELEGNTDKVIAMDFTGSKSVTGKDAERQAYSDSNTSLYRNFFVKSIMN